MELQYRHNTVYSLKTNPFYPYTQYSRDTHVKYYFAKGPSSSSFSISQLVKMQLFIIVDLDCEESLGISPQSPLQPSSPPNFPSFGQQWFLISINHQVIFLVSLFLQRTGDIQKVHVLHPLEYPCTDDRRDCIYIVIPFSIHVQRRSG